MTLRSFHRRSLILLALVSVACTPDDGDDTPVVERTTVGDTTIVRTVSGSVWGDTARLVEEVRIGALDGPEETTFGSVDQVVPRRDGGVDVFDSQAFALRRYDSTGAFVKQIGRRGQGPGEYEQIIGMRALSDGRLAAYDGRNTRITTYSPNGDPATTWPLQLSVRVFSDNAFAVDRTDHMYVQTQRPRQTQGPSSDGIMLRFGPDGTITDTLEIPRWPASAQTQGVCLGPSGRWAMHPSGQLLSGYTNTYSIDLRQPAGKVLRMQRTATPVAFESGERAELEDDIARSGPPIESMSISQGKAPVIQYGPRQTVPQTKPIFRNLVAGLDGRIWVQLHTRAVKINPDSVTVRPACSVDRKGDPPKISWREPILWDVFEEDGDYLGVVAVPPRTSLRAMDGDRVWAVQRGDSDEEYVVRYRIAR